MGFGDIDRFVRENRADCLADCREFQIFLPVHTQGFFVAEVHGGVRVDDVEVGRLLLLRRWEFGRDRLRRRLRDQDCVADEGFLGGLRVLIRF